MFGGGRAQFSPPLLSDVMLLYAVSLRAAWKYMKYRNPVGAACGQWCTHSAHPPLKGTHTVSSLSLSVFNLTPSLSLSDSHLPLPLWISSSCPRSLSEAASAAAASVRYITKVFLLGYKGPFGCWNSWHVALCDDTQKWPEWTALWPQATRGRTDE